MQFLAVFLGPLIGAFLGSFGAMILINWMAFR